MKLSICGADISEFTLILPSFPAPAEKTAAEFLRRIIKASCGTELKISSFPVSHSIFIGGGDIPKDIKWDGFCISTDALNLYLRGRIPRGSLYAAYSFAERFLNYRGFAPDAELITDVGSAEIADNFYEIDNPVFERRANDWIGFSSFPENASLGRINSYNHGEKYGGYIGIIGGCHTMEGLCPPEKYFAEHPEYYSLCDGKRIPAGNVFDRPSGQLCLSNPDVLRIVVENVLERLRANPDIKIIDVSQNDNDNYCRCEKCAAIDKQEGSPSGLMLRFVNAVAEAVEKEFPDILVQTFAYSYTRKPPLITKPRKNVIIRYCTIEACFRHPINDKSCEKNAGIFSEELSAWRKICDKISIWDYVTNYSCYMAPYPNFDVLRENAKFFAENHAVHVFEEDTPGCWSGEFGDLKAYVIAKLLWNPYMSEEVYRAHIDEFLQTYYGPGWKNIKQYIRLEADTTRDLHLGCFQDMDTVHYLGPDYPGGGETALGDYEPQAYQRIYEDSYLNSFIECLSEAKALWDAAERAAETDLQRMHIERSRMPLKYVELFCTEHDRERMSADERSIYEEAVKKYKADKVRFGLHTNIWTARYRGR